jgi:GTP-binding protein
MSTLMDFRLKRHFRADDGEMGGTKRCSGKDGKDLIIKVPRGTLVRDAASGALLQDMSGDAPFIVAKGGRGGWGNARFATPTRQAPRFAKPGQPGQALELQLELKLIADVGLIGFPNVGKSTLLSVISAARPKIANYHFTTLAPNLGVVSVEAGAAFVAADIPGIIEGAAQGAGLGLDFLRHIDRCRLLVHVVDASGSEGRDPVADMGAINAELTDYSPTLATRPQIIAANKADILPPDSDNLARLQASADALGWPLHTLSAATGDGVQALIYAVWNALQALPPVAVFAPDAVPEPPAPGAREITITRDASGVWQIAGAWIEKIAASVNFDDYESRMYFERMLRKAGVYDQLERDGVAEGDTVDVLGMQFNYVF